MKAYELAAENKGMREEVERLRAELVETQTGKDSFTVPYDYALLLDENAAMREEIGELRAELAECQRLLHRYRNETPLGHQPHMIAHEVDAALAADEENSDEA